MRSWQRSVRTRQRQVGIAWISAISGHVLLAFLLIAPSKGALLTGLSQSGQDAGGAAEMTVQLVRARDVLTAEVLQKSGDLQPLFAKYDNGLAPVSTTSDPKSDLNKLFQRVAAAEPSPRRGVPEEADGSGDERLPQADAGDGQTGKPVATGGGGLWGVVAPCWESMAHKAAVPVTLDITLDARGRVTSPPTIIRPQGANLTEGRLRAESLALAALSACLARGDPRFGGRVYRLRFDASS
jgi:hypothetical protein